MAALYFVADLSQPEGFLDEEEARHVVKVLRLRAGDSLNLTDGRGNKAWARLTETAHPAKARYRIDKVEPQAPLRPYQLHLAVGFPRHPDRLEWLVEKAVEMGIDRLTLLQCEHSEALKIKPERLLKLAQSALKQSGQYRLPAIEGPIAFSTFLQQEAAGTSLKLMAHLREGERLPLRQVLGPEPRPCTVLVGPEGDFSAGELAQALAQGWQSVTFGPTTLRTETAGLYAVAALSVLWA